MWTPGKTLRHGCPPCCVRITDKENRAGVNSAASPEVTEAHMCGSKAATVKTASVALTLALEGRWGLTDPPLKDFKFQNPT